MTQTFTAEERLVIHRALEAVDVRLLTSIGEFDRQGDSGGVELARRERNAIKLLIETLNAKPKAAPLYDIRWRGRGAAGNIVVADPVNALQIALGWAEKEGVDTVRVLVGGKFVATFDPAGYLKEQRRNAALAKLTDEDKVVLGLAVDTGRAS